MLLIEYGEKTANNRSGAALTHFHLKQLILTPILLLYSPKCGCKNSKVACYW